MRINLYSLMLFGILTPSTEQNREAGGAAGFGFYRSTAIKGPTGSGRARFGPRFVLSAGSPTFGVISSAGPARQIEAGLRILF